MTESKLSASGFDRRTVAKGALWSAPVIAVAGSAPALATSPACTPQLVFSGGLGYNQGVIGSSSGTTNQTVTFGGETFVNNLPVGVTVTSIKYQFWVQNRIDQNSSGPGVFFLANSTASTHTACTSAGCSLTWSPSSTGFSTTVTNTANLRNITYPDGVTRQSWDLNMTWAPPANASTKYTPAGSCQNFDTGSSGHFQVNYTNVKALTNADLANGKGVVNSVVTVTVTLSNGTVLTATAQAH